MNATERNALARKFVEDKLELVSTLSESDFSTLPKFHKLLQTLEDLICVKPMGFRGVVATAITGQYLNADFDPLNDFYSCNPRSIFEQGIFYAFKGKIPCGKSDPLNVAKNVNELNEQWAKGKRPESSAKAAVVFLRYLRDQPEHFKEQAENLFFLKLLDYADSIRSIPIAHPEEKGYSNQVFADKCISFALDFPESGTVPELIVSSLLEKLYEQSDISVVGGDGSVFSTNTTSKKPADVWVEHDRKVQTLFEITVKKIDDKRLQDCTSSLIELGLYGLPIHFVCRIPEDTASLTGIRNNSLKINGKTINFVDIRHFIRSTAALISAKQIEEILFKANEFVGSIDRPINTKDGWNKIFGAD